MYVGADFSVTNPGERETYVLDFVNDILPTDTIISAVWTCEVAYGYDATPASHIVGAATIAGSKVGGTFVGFLTGVKYRLTATVTLLSGNVVKLYSHVFCQPAK